MMRKKSDFSTRVLIALKRKNIKRVKLSEMTGINKGNLSKYLNGIINPKLDKIELIAKALDVSPAWLLGYDVPIESDNHVEKYINIIDINNLENIEITEKQHNYGLRNNLIKQINEKEYIDTTRLPHTNDILLENYQYARYTIKIDKIISLVKDLSDEEVEKVVLFIGVLKERR